MFAANNTAEVAQIGSVTIVRLPHERLDHTAVKEIAGVVQQAVDSAALPYVVVDLPQAKLIGSAGIIMLLRAWDSVKGRGGRLAVSGLSGYCTEVLTVSKLDRLWQLSPSAVEAARQLAEAA